MYLWMYKCIYMNVYTNVYECTWMYYAKELVFIQPTEVSLCPYKLLPMSPRTYRGTRWPCQNAAGPPECSHGKACHVLPHITKVLVVSWPYDRLIVMIFYDILCLFSALNCLIILIYFDHCLSFGNIKVLLSLDVATSFRISLSPTNPWGSGRSYWDGIIQEMD